MKLTRKYLIKWAEYQRASYRVKRLKPARAALLEKIPGWRWRFKEYKTLSQQVLAAEKLAKKNGGFLPRGLQSKGFGGLYQCIEKNSKAFAHIPLEPSKIKTLSEYVAIAEALAKQHGGVLPGHRKLLNTGFKRLYGVIHDNPKIFAHIPQEVKTLAGYVVQAERLAKQHGGVLPDKLWRRNNGYRTLTKHIEKFTEAFSHVPVQNTDYAHLKLQKQVLAAEKLAKKNGGLLPRGLQSKGYEVLQKNMRYNPKAFAHIPQEPPVHKTLQEHIAQAEHLAKRNGGLLPRPIKLDRMGFGSLQQRMALRPEAFVHIPQEPPIRKTLQEHIAQAEHLAKRQGVLPRPIRLKRMGYSALRTSLRDHPESFVHIPQEQYSIGRPKKEKTC